MLRCSCCRCGCMKSLLARRGACSQQRRTTRHFIVAATRPAASHCSRPRVSDPESSGSGLS
ncbi:uncharacterized protein B0I36DRAFT_316578 [Microdochium trichocladiopsis]|uniref:Uncharacterized protein n=1 Tax=Microdochium trichocladiopsis TaxID=1682393 RepID=A0A9P9BQ77_9PEZI|nr:uncharacterized protein B0I36DRAFT_316578 [Microdochium trichocladiopsis]KAH7034588.1 hypothetical protein B0I36DRAFT_316578 [Microdochium trichocladiopsis]